MSHWTDLAQWRGPSPNTGDGDSKLDESADRMYEHRGVVVHIAVGYYEGTISWQKNPDANVSSHFVVGRDGRTAQVVDTDIRAWTQSDGNGHWLSVENEGFLEGDHRNPGDWHLLSPQMIEANAQLLARAHREYGVPLQLATSPAGRGLGYHSMGAETGYNWGHSSCPGEPIKAQLPKVLARAIEIVNGEDMGWKDPLTLVIDGKPVTAEAQNWLMGANDAAWKTLWAVKAAEAADATRDATLLTAINAISGTGGPDAAPVVAAIREQGEATRALVTEQHQAEMAALRAERDAEVAALRAELAALAGTPAS